MTIKGRRPVTVRKEKLLLSPPPLSTPRRISSRLSSNTSSCISSPVKKRKVVKKSPPLPDHLPLPGREEEYDYILDRLSSALHSKQGSTIYISGVPGTGKTATVRQCIAKLNSLQLIQNDPEYRPSDEDIFSSSPSISATKAIPKFDYLEINGMRLSDVNQTYSILLNHLMGVKKSSNCLARLNDFFKKKREKPIIVLLDELDLLLKRKVKTGTINSASLLYNFFEWTGWPEAKIIVVAIANTMDLPERFLPNRIASRMGSNRINFKPYSYPQLMAIILHRKGGEWGRQFHPDALEYCCRKVSAVSGDARRALSLAQRAVDFLSPKKGEIISIPMMEMAIRMTSAANSTQVIKDLSFQERIFLLSIILNLRLSNNGVALFESICEGHWQLLRSNNYSGNTITYLGLQRIFDTLQSLNILQKDSSSSLSPLQKVRLIISEEEVCNALRSPPDSSPIFDRHLQAIIR